MQKLVVRGRHPCLEGQHRSGKIVAGTACAMLFAAMAANSVWARDLMMGVSIPDNLIVPNHPAVKHAIPISRELIATQGPLKAQMSCPYLDARGELGRVTFAGILHTVGSGFQIDPGVFKGAIDPARVMALRGDRANLTPRVADLLIEYARKRSGSDPVRAAQFIREAERHDAECVRRFVAEARARVELAEQKLMLDYDRLGRPLVYRILPQDMPLVPRLIQEEVRKVAAFDEFAAAMVRGYGVTYARLSQTHPPEKGKIPGGGVQEAAPKQEKKAVGPKTAEGQPVKTVSGEPAAGREIENAYADFRQQLQRLREFCLLKARGDCG